MAGKTVLEALHGKYGGTDSGVCDIYLPANAPGKTDSGELQLPACLVLDNLGIQCAGNEGELINLCTNAQELDITKNNLTSWREIFKILYQLPKIHFLNMSFNDLSEDLDSEGHLPLDNITKLILNSTHVTWATVDEVLNQMPRITELHLSLNSFSKVNIQAKHTSLKSLFFNDNKISEWKEICKLGSAFQNLEHLVVLQNTFNRFEDKDTSERCFPKLKSLIISECGIQDWEDIDKLNDLPELTDVRLKGIPLLQDLTEKEQRGFVIARLPKLTRLNGSPVRDVEREEGERAFIRYYMDKQDKPKRFYELETKHGKLHPLANVKFETKNNANVLIKFGQKQKLERLDLNLTVLQLKKMLVDFAETPTSKMLLFHHSQHGWLGREQLKYPKKQLYTIPIEDEDILSIEIKK